MVNSGSIRFDTLEEYQCSSLDHTSLHSKSLITSVVDSAQAFIFLLCFHLSCSPHYHEYAGYHQYLSNIHKLFSSWCLSPVWGQGWLCLQYFRQTNLMTSPPKTLHLSEEPTFSRLILRATTLSGFTHRHTCTQPWHAPSRANEYPIPANRSTTVSPEQSNLDSQLLWCFQQQNMDLVISKW